MIFPDTQIHLVFDLYPEDSIDLTRPESCGRQREAVLPTKTDNRIHVLNSCKKMGKMAAYNKRSYDKKARAVDIEVGHRVLMRDRSEGTDKLLGAQYICCHREEGKFASLLYQEHSQEIRVLHMGIYSEFLGSNAIHTFLGVHNCNNLDQMEEDDRAAPTSWLIKDNLD